MLDLQSLSMPLACWFAETTLVASALALVAHLVARFGGTSPAIRHTLWLVVLIKLMTPPIVHWPWSHPLARQPVESTASVPLVDPIEAGNPARPAPRRYLDEGRPVSDVADGRLATIQEAPLWLGAGWPFWGWLAGSLIVGGDQLRRIVRFRAKLRDARPAPPWLVAEAGSIGRRLSVKVPTMRVVDRLSTPLLWCLGRPVLLVPAGLVGSLGADRWRGVLAHELAHLRRGDPWVGRLELVALLVWWWNPLYWLARRRIDLEAELACDAWVVWALPAGRIEYAESLVRICATPRLVKAPAPALGVAGPGRFLERRLIMILRERVSHVAPLPGLLAALVLAAIAAPSWTFADSPTPTTGASTVSVDPTGPTPILSVVSVAIDDDDDAEQAKALENYKKLKARLEAKAKAKREAGAKAGPAGETPGPELEKKLEAIGKQIAVQVEAKFGPDFEKKMEAIGKEMEVKFGPEFQKHMEAMGKEIEKQFGPGSDFAKEMKTLGERMAKEFGPGSDLERKMKDLAKIKGVVDPAKEKTDAESDLRVAEAVKGVAAKAKKDAERARTDRSATATRKEATEARRARRIEALESRIDEMMKELKQLKSQDDDDQADKK